MQGSLTTDKSYARCFATSTLYSGLMMRFSFRYVVTHIAIEIFLVWCSSFFFGELLN